MIETSGKADAETVAETIAPDRFDFVVKSG